MKALPHAHAFSPQMPAKTKYKGEEIMRRKPFRVEIILCQVSMTIVLVCIFCCSIFLAINIFTIYTDNHGIDLGLNTFYFTTEAKTIEVCKPDFFICANLR